MNNTHIHKPATKNTLSTERTKLEKEQSALINEIKDLEKKVTDQKIKTSEIANQYKPLLKTGGNDLLVEYLEKLEAPEQAIKLLEDEISDKNLEISMKLNRVSEIDEQLLKFEKDEVSREINGLLGTRNFKDQPEAIRKIQAALNDALEEIKRVKGGF